MKKSSCVVTLTPNLLEALSPEGRGKVPVHVAAAAVASIAEESGQTGDMLNNGIIFQRESPHLTSPRWRYATNSQQQHDSNPFSAKNTFLQS